MKNSTTTDDYRDDRYQEMAARIIWEEHGSVVRGDAAAKRASEVQPDAPDAYLTF